MTPTTQPPVFSHGENADLPEITSPPAKTAGEEDHSDPDVFRGEDADAPGDPTPGDSTPVDPASGVSK